MALWAIKHSRWRSSSARRTHALLGGRSLVACAVLVALLAAPPSANATHVPGPILRDTNGPPLGLEPADDGAVQPGGVRGVAQPRPGDIQRQGSVVALFDDPADPLIVIAVDSGYLTVRLRCGALCPRIHLGDVVVAAGQRRSEAVLDARDVWVVSP